MTKGSWMLTTTAVFGGMSTNDISAAITFYRDTLGFEVNESTNGLRIRAGDHEVFMYPKPDHEPAGYTALYLDVPDIDAAVDALVAKGITFERYDGIPHDDRGIARGKAAGQGPDIAWFTDPAGNVLAVLNG